MGLALYTYQNDTTLTTGDTSCVEDVVQLGLIRC